MNEKKKYINFGCGIYAPPEWDNYDISPTLKIRKIPLFGKLISKLFHDIPFPDYVKEGNIVNGLPILANSIDVIYSSHVLEHMSFEDAQKAISNVFLYLKPGGIFRSVLPDLEILMKEYERNKLENNNNAANLFLKESLLGLEQKPKGMLRKFISFFGNYHHLWMWDFASINQELHNVGFVNIRRCSPGESKDSMIRLIEDPSRFVKALYFEATKPLL